MREKTISICIVGMMLITTGLSASATILKNGQEFRTVSNKSSNNYGEIINITAQEAWDLLNDTDNGIQIPIDVRFDFEWYSGFIDTSWPESPIWYCMDLFQDTWLEWFIDEYDGEEIILYCKGGCRSIIVADILSQSDFTGTIYNMLGGIYTWIIEGYPIRNNTPPETPNIYGPSKLKNRVEADFTFTTYDAEADGVCYFIDWGDGNTETTEYDYSTAEVTVSHTWVKKNTYIIKAKAIDFYGNESDFASLEIEVPRTKQYTNFNLLQRFPLTYQLFRYLKNKL